MIKVLFIEMQIFGNGKLVGFLVVFLFSIWKVILSLFHLHFSHRDPEWRTSGNRKWMKGWMHFYLSTLSRVLLSTAFGAKVSHVVALCVLTNCHMKEHVTMYWQIVTSIHVKKPKCYYIISSSYIKYDNCERLKFEFKLMLRNCGSFTFLAPRQNKEVNQLCQTIVLGNINPFFMKQLVWLETLLKLECTAVTALM